MPRKNHRRSRRSHGRGRTSRFDLDTRRVVRLRAEIIAGRYRPNLAAIAGGILELEQLLASG